MVISLPQSYSTLRTILMSSNDKLTIDTVKSQVLIEEKSRQASTSHSALAAKTSATSHVGNLDTSQSTSQTDKEKPLRLFMARSRPDTSISEWVVDSGASAHMCCQRPWFVSFQKLNPTQPVIIGDGRSILATGKGRIEVTMHLDNGRASPTILRDVYYVPDLRKSRMQSNSK